LAELAPEVSVGYSLFIEGLDGARKVRRGSVPRKGEWLNVRLQGRWWWLPVLDVTHMLSCGRPFDEEGCDILHETAEGIVFSSLAVGVRVEVSEPEESYKLVLPPSRWPLGGVALSRQAAPSGFQQT
jgi:hypothetical protein